VVIVLHYINQAGSHADRIVALKGGQVVANGTPIEILTLPTLLGIFGFEMRVEMIDGYPTLLHFR
jgi:iron complex transport system ATP-binding protein